MLNEIARELSDAELAEVTGGCGCGCGGPPPVRNTAPGQNNHPGAVGNSFPMLLDGVMVGPGVTYPCGVHREFQD
jgi:hypothetical protein